MTSKGKVLVKISVVVPEDEAPNDQFKAWLIGDLSHTFQVPVESIGIEVEEITDYNEVFKFLKTYIEDLHSS